MDEARRSKITWDVSGFVRLFLILTKNRFLLKMYDKFMKNAILLAKNQEYVSRKCKKSYFSTKYRISAQKRIRPCEMIFSKLTETRFHK